MLTLGSRVNDAESLPLEVETLSGEPKSLGGHPDMAITGLQAPSYYRLFELSNSIGERLVGLD